jgi:hypothetical protein
LSNKEIRHAIRFTAQITRRAYIAPARHWASSNTSVDRPPMGMRVRLKASVDISGYSPAMQVILRAMKKYGLILADNGSNFFISGAPDPRWDDDELNTFETDQGHELRSREDGQHHHTRQSHPQITQSLFCVICGICGLLLLLSFGGGVLAPAIQLLHQLFNRGLELTIAPGQRVLCLLSTSRSGCTP